MHTTKIATCCYCGTRAALVLDRGRHELTCSTCGAPLREMKSLPLDRTAAGPRTATAPTGPEPHAPRLRQFETPRDSDRKPKPKKPYHAMPHKKRKGKSLRRKVLGKIWDAVEDILD